MSDKLYTKLKKEGYYTKSYSDFKNKYLIDDSRLSELYATLKNNDYFGEFAPEITTFDEFKKYYSLNVAPTAQFLPCTPNKTPVKSKSGQLLAINKTTVWDKPTVYIYPTKDGKTSRFYVKTGEHEGKMGTVSCNGKGNYYVLDEVAKKNQQQQASSPTQPKKTWNIVTFGAEDIISGNQTLKWGDKGQIVGELQQLLTKIGMGDISADGSIDNKFGKRTYNTVKNLQQGALGDSNPTGTVDSTTWQGLNNLVKNKDIQKNDIYSDEPIKTEPEQEVRKPKFNIDEPPGEFKMDAPGQIKTKEMMAENNKIKLTLTSMLKYDKDVNYKDINLDLL
jgi:hypothetical protein